MSDEVAIVWFRQDLRLSDHAALTQACMRSARLLPVYAYAPQAEGDWPPGAASRWFLHGALDDLHAQLVARGSGLTILSGDPTTALCALAQKVGAQAVYAHRRYEPAAMAQERALESALANMGVAWSACEEAVLQSPQRLMNLSGRPYQVFTPFWRALQGEIMRSPPCRLSSPRTLPPLPDLEGSPCVSLMDLGLLPASGWDAGLREAWRPTRAAAQAALTSFVTDWLEGYPRQRDLPGVESGVSRLSPWLHLGQLSVAEVFEGIADVARAEPARREAALAFLRQLGWREFAYHLLAHFPHTATRPLKGAFERFDWREDAAHLAAWRRGETGYPLVDAGMRQLWRIGWMHNRARMIAASFLVKNLRLHWLEGARWFWDTLVDADLANNTLGWQWVAGCGADAAPYFRIFNPLEQARKFDSRGDYLRRWLPELAALPDAALRAPWQADGATLRAAGVKLGSTYPRPIVSLATTRMDALAAFQRLKSDGLGR